MQKVFVIFHRGVEVTRFLGKSEAIMWLNDQIGDHPSRSDYEIVQLHSPVEVNVSAEEQAREKFISNLFIEG